VKTKDLRAAGILAVAAVAGYGVVSALVGGAPTSRTSGAPARPSVNAKESSGSPRALRRQMRLSTTALVSQRSASGAVAAASSYLALVDDIPPTSLAPERLRFLTTPPVTTEALHAQAAAAALAHQLGSQRPAFIRGWRLGWRIDSYRSDEARIALWTVGMVYSAREVLAPYWSTTVCAVAWFGDRWRISAAQTTAGPTPPMDGSDPVAVAAFARAASNFHSFGNAT
jgi:hypothetical protein